MKRGIFSILAVLAVFAMVTLGCPEVPPAEVPPLEGEKDIEFTVDQDGRADSSTTQLNLHFNKVIELDKTEIELGGVTGVTIGTGELKPAQATWIVPINYDATETKSSTLTVKITKEGYTINGDEGSSTREVTIYKYVVPGATVVTFDGAEADGGANTTTTEQLTLTFSKAVTGLTAGHITLSGVKGVMKGEPLAAGNAAGKYTLPIGGFTTNGDLIVAVENKVPGFNISGASKTVPIFYVTPAEFTNLSGNGTKDTVTTTEIYLAFDKVITGLSANDITVTGVDGVGKGQLTNQGAYYTLKLTGTDTVANAGTLTVTVKKDGYNIKQPAKNTVDFHKQKVAVTFSKVEADGSKEDEETTTTLTLTFSAAIDNLTSGDITITPAVTKGKFTALTGSDSGKYTLAISNFKSLVNAAGERELSVAVANKTGYDITGSPQKVTIYYFEKTVEFTSLTANGSTTETTTALTLTFDKEIAGLTANEIKLSGVTPIIKGTLSGPVTAGGKSVYTLPISGFTTPPAGSPLTVEFDIFGYEIINNFLDEDDEPIDPIIVTIYFKGQTVTFGVTADGSAAETTTALTLTFSEAIIGLTADDITLTAGDTGAVKGALTEGATAGTYKLAISGVTKAGEVSVAVAKTGYIITGSPKTVTIFFAAPDFFDNAVGMKTGITIYGSGSHSFDETTGILTISGNGGFSVPLPDGFTVADTVEIEYAARLAEGTEVKFTKKQVDGWTDVNPASYPTFNTTEVSKIQVTGFSAAGVTAGKAFFQTNGTFKVELKIISITRIEGEAIKISTAVPGLKPAAGETPETTVDTTQYTGAVSWSPAVSTTFVSGTVYTATIVLTKKTGFTFEGVAANAIGVIGANADDVTHPTGGIGTLTITAVFPATAAPATDLTLTFTDGDVTGVGATVVVEGDGTGFTATNTSGYQNGFVYFKVKFDSTFKLSDYSKIDIDGTPISGDSTYKPIRVAAYADTTDVGATLGDTNTHIIASAIGNQLTGTNETKTIHLDIGSLPAGTDLNEVYIGICIHANTGAVYKLANIKFYN